MPHIGLKPDDLKEAVKACNHPYLSKDSDLNADYKVTYFCLSCGHKTIIGRRQLVLNHFEEVYRYTVPENPEVTTKALLKSAPGL